MYQFFLAFLATNYDAATPSEDGRKTALSKSVCKIYTEGRFLFFSTTRPSQTVPQKTAH